MFRKTVLKSQQDLNNILIIYRKLGYQLSFKNPDKYPCLMITYTDRESERLDYQGEVYNCYIYLDDLKQLI